MPDAKNLKETLQRDLDSLAGVRDELRLQLRLAKTEVQDEWTRLESVYQRVENEIRTITENARTPVKDIGQAARTLMDELRHGYSRIKTQLEDGLRGGRPS